MFRISLVILFVFIFSSCATQVAPGGGPIDREKPLIKNATPKNYSTNFSNTVIVLEFDENIQIENINDELLTSPYLNIKENIKQKKKALIIKVPDSLQENTTYSLNFGDAIRDYNENNIFENFTYVFSTGEYLDSAKLEGVVKSALTKEAIEDCNVFLYSTKNTDSAILLSEPLYTSKTSSNGLFNFKNIKPGDYYIYALKEKIKNYIYDDINNEEFAFNSKSIQVDTATNFIQLNLFSAAPDTFIFTDKILNTNSSITYLANQEIDSVSLLVRSLTPNFKIIYIIEKSRFTIWTDSLLFDSITIETTYLGIKDTFQFLNINKIKPKESAIFKLNPKLQGNTLKPYSDLKITSSHPITTINKQLIYLFEDSLPKDFTIRSSVNSFTIQYPFKFAKKYEFIIDSNALEDNFNLKSDSSYFKYQVDDVSNFGELIINLANDSLTKSIKFLQLCTEKFDVLETIIVTQKQHTIKGLEPGKYKLRGIQDSNLNGKWDTGNYLTKTQPENIFNHPTLLNVRANWELEISFTP
jgi:hypothetical protein